MGILNPIIAARSTRMFGTTLPEEDLINVGIGPNLSVSKSPTGYVKPDLTFEDVLKINISGVEVELYMHRVKQMIRFLFGCLIISL